MIVLDTNVLSEVLRPVPESAVMDWLAMQPRVSLFTTAVTRGEILYGIRLLPDGKRRRGLWEAAKAIFDEDFAGQVLSFDNDAADMYAEISASRRSSGSRRTPSSTRLSSSRPSTSCSVVCSAAIIVVSSIGEAGLRARSR